MLYFGFFFFTCPSQLRLHGGVSFHKCITVSAFWTELPPHYSFVQIPEIKNRNDTLKQGGIQLLKLLQQRAVFFPTKGTQHHVKAKLVKLNSREQVFAVDSTEINYYSFGLTAHPDWNWLPCTNLTRYTSRMHCFYKEVLRTQQYFTDPENQQNSCQYT